MARDFWTQDIRRFNIPDDDEPETVAQVVRRGGKTLDPEQVAREQEAQRRAEREREARDPLMRMTISPGPGGEATERVEKLVRNGSGAQEWVPAPTTKNDQALGQSQPGPRGRAS